MFDTTVLQAFTVATAVGAPVPPLPAPFGAIRVVDGRMDGLGDRDVFRLDVLPGHRYLVGLAAAPGPISDDAARSGGASWSEPYWAVNADVNGWGLVGVGSKYFGSPETNFRLLEPGTADSLLLTVGGDGSLSSGVDYRLTLVEITADDHAPWVEVATLLPVGARRTGVIDLPGDCDAFTIALRAGQRVQIAIDRLDGLQGAELVAFLGAGPVGDDVTTTGFALRLDNTQPARQAGVFMAEADGAYTIQVSASIMENWSTLPVQAIARYAISVLEIEPDVAGDGREQARAIALGETVPVALEIRGDTDWLRFDATGGQAYRIAVANPEGEPTSRLPTVVIGESTTDYSQRAQLPWVTGSSSDFVWWATSSGAAEIQLSWPAWFGQGDPKPGSDLPYEVDVTVTPLPAEEAGAAPADLDLRPGQTVTVEAARDFVLTTVRLHLVAGERYRLDATGPVYDGMLFPGSEVRQIMSGSHFIPLAPGAYAWQQEEPAAGRFTYVTAPATGVYELSIVAGTFAPLTLRLAPTPRDDHGDIPEQATRLVLGEPVLAELSRIDVDLFRVDLLAGQRYRIAIDVGTGALDALDLFGDGPSRRWQLPSGDTDIVFVPESGGTYWLMPWGAAQFQLRVDEASGTDDHADVASEAAVIDLVGHPRLAADGVAMPGFFPG